MKKTIIASVLGLAACAAVNTSYGQGSLILGNYSYGAQNYSAPVTLGGSLIGNNFTSALLYSSTGLAGSFSLVPGSQEPFWSNSDVPGYQGLFGQFGVTLPSYTTGPAYFEVVAYNGTAYNDPSSSIQGISGVVTYATLATSANLHAAGDMFLDNTDITTPLTPFTVSPVPEPTTLALAGLGGLASLVAFRRKQS
jgi:hypothetical protein